MIRENAQALSRWENTASQTAGIHPHSPAQGQGHCGKAQESGQKWMGGLRGLCESSKKETTPNPNGLDTNTQTSVGEENFSLLPFKVFGWSNN